MAYSTITKPSLYFNTKLYTGNAGTQSLTGVGFQPDFTWIKVRNYDNPHNLFDAVRGVTKAINSNDNTAEETRSSSLTAFDSDGFSIGNDSQINDTSSYTYASWNWKANGQGSANTDGSINTIYTSANTTSGVSIIKYTGNGSNATVGHGLGVAPKFVIVKVLSTNNDWMVGMSTLDQAGGQPWHKYQYLNDAAAEADANTMWNDTAPTTTTVSLGTHSYVNYSGRNYIMYAFAEKTGYSKIGSYKGNNNADGTFVYCGFKPSFVMIKHSGSSNWTINDTARDPTNVNNLRLFPNQNVVESSSSDSMDMLSNGFKLRSTDSGNNGTSGTYSYMAIAEEPLVANVGASIPATAR